MFVILRKENILIVFILLIQQKMETDLKGKRVESVIRSFITKEMRYLSSFTNT